LKVIGGYLPIIRRPDRQPDFTYYVVPRQRPPDVRIITVITVVAKNKAISFGNFKLFHGVTRRVQNIRFR
jgi:hypothetical protein